MNFKGKNVMVVSPCYGGIETETIACTQQLINYSMWYIPSTDGRLPVNSVEWRFAKASSPAWVRNSAVDMFMASDARHLLMIDRDHIFHYTYLETLFEADKDIISALATTKRESLQDHDKPIVPVCSRIVDGKVKGYTQEEVEKIVKDNKEQPFEVDMCGMAFVLIKRKVFEEVKRPWFCQPESNFENNPQGCSGEDYYFVKKAKEAGFKTFVHPKCAIIHIGKGYYGMGSR